MEGHSAQGSWWTEVSRLGVFLCPLPYILRPPPPQIDSLEVGRNTQYVFSLPLYLGINYENGGEKSGFRLKNGFSRFTFAAEGVDVAPVKKQTAERRALAPSGETAGPSGEEKKHDGCFHTCDTLVRSQTIILFCVRTALL